MRIRPRTNSAVAWADFALVVSATVMFAIVSAHFELGEAISAWTHPRERYQLEELPGVLLVMALGGAWFAWRRTGEARRELQRRFVIEGELTAALSENRRLERENMRIQEEERRILARELHDELGQYLNAIKLEAVCLRSSGPSDGTQTERSAASIVAIVDQVQATVRDMVRRLRPAGLDELGLAAAIEECIDGWRRRLPAVRFEYDFTAPRSNWGEAVNMTLYRLVQEGLTNVARHSQASSVAISLQQLAGSSNPAGVIRLDIRDDGVGIVTPRASTSGVGLTGMRERVESLGGRFEAVNAAHGGFHIAASIPLPELAV